MKTRFTTLALFICLAVFNGKAYGNNLTADSLQLVSFYNAMDGPNWNTTWDLSQPVSTWEGISINNCQVTHLILSFNGLTGTIPDLDLPAILEFELNIAKITGPVPDFSGMPNLLELIIAATSDSPPNDMPNFSNLPKLKRLNLRGFKSSTAMPDFANLTELEYLYISSCEFPGTMTNLSLPNLKLLTFIYNFIDGPIPNFDLPNLEELNLKKSELTGPLPNFDLPNLIEMDLSQNNLEGTIPLWDLPNLEEMILEQNSLTGGIPDFNMPKLRTLRLRSNQLDGTIPDFTGVPELRYLEANANQLTGVLPDFSNVPLLFSIRLFFNNLSGPVPNFSNIPQLSTLKISNNNFSGPIPSFEYLVNLFSIDISTNQLTGTLPSFVNSPNLLSINLSSNLLTGTIPNYPNLDGLWLNNNQLTGEIPDLNNCPDLRRLFLHSNQLTGSIPNFNTPKLEDCWLSYNQLTGEIPEFNLPLLERFYAFTNQLTGSIPSFINCPLLSALGLSENQLSGCYDPNLCNIGTAYFDENPGLPNSGSQQTFFYYCIDNDSQYGKPCDDGNPNTTGEIINLDCECAAASHVITGNVFHDLNENCLLENDDVGLENWLIKYENAFTRYANTDSLGNYNIYVNAGSYQVSLVQKNIYWTPCLLDSALVLDNSNDTIRIDFPLQVEYNCPLMQVDVGAPFIRRCFANTYTVSYCNEGTVSENNAYVEVTFDEFTTVDSSSVPWTSQTGNTFTFPIGFVDVGDCGNFRVHTTLDCDSTFLGQAHCVEAHIYPDSICLPPNTLWDGSTIMVDGNCVGDSILFSIENTGSNDMQAPLNYIVVEDQIIHLNGTFQLNSGDTQQLAIPATGQTYRLEADQAPFHPTNGMPSVTIEACSVDGGAISLGFLNMFANNEQDPFRTVFCGNNIGSFDPNDKRGFPLGLGDNHIIYPDTDLDYQIRFQNTGTDTAFTVIIRDTISTDLNLETFRPGASSHEYEWQLFPGNMVEFRFYDIMLPDSNVNEVASHGFVNYKIEQQADNLPGTVINNQAAIYFDFNDPIFTNITTHRIEDKPTLLDTLYSTYCTSDIYNTDTVALIPSNLSSFEIATTHFVTILGEQQSTIDTMITEGTLFNGLPYSNDTSFTLVYEDINGCDSTVTINLDILTSTDTKPDAITSLTLVPNPVQGDLYLQIRLKENTTLDLQIFNQQGQQVQVSRALPLQKGLQRVPVDVRQLAPGVYFLQLTSAQAQWTEKLFIY